MQRARVLFECHDDDDVKKKEKKALSTGSSPQERIKLSARG